MIESYIKYLFIFTCAFYVFTKLLNLNFPKKKLFIHITFFIIFDAFILYVRSHVPYMTTLTLLITIFVYTTITYNMTIKITMTASLLSVGLSYFMFYVSTLLTSPLSLLTLSKLISKHSLYLILMIIVGTLQLTLCFLLFRIKRLKRGMPFLLEKIPSAIGIFISLFIIFLTSLFILLEENYLVSILILICTALGFILFLWWRKQLTISYLNRAHRNEILRLEEELEKVKKDNEHLAKLIHKDNKLIPAMEMAVKSLLSDPCIFHNDELHLKATDLLADLNKLTEERAGVLNAGNRRNSLPATGLVRLDSVISYMYEKALSKNIKLEVTIDIDVREMIKKVISEDILVTLIADLTENAIIATNHAETKNILLSLNMENKNYCISIFDSGIHFEPYTIENAGRKKASTHLDDGGSGIGLMTTFTLLRECRASFIIDESIDNEQYTKKISILFDFMNEFRIYSHREEILTVAHGRGDIVVNI